MFSCWSCECCRKLSTYYFLQATATLVINETLILIVVLVLLSIVNFNIGVAKSERSLVYESETINCGFQFIV